jgi:hypothetical protein
VSNVTNTVQHTNKFTHVYGPTDIYTSTPRLRMNGAKPLLPYMPSGCGKENLYFFTDIYL